MPDTVKTDAEKKKIDELYEMAGFCEEPRNKDLVAEARWVIESQFMVIIEACERYNDTIANWEGYVNDKVLPRVVGLLKEKLEADKAAAGTVIQGVLTSLQAVLDADRARLGKLRENVQLLGGAV